MNQSWLLWVCAEFISYSPQGLLLPQNDSVGNLAADVSP